MSDAFLGMLVDCGEGSYGQLKRSLGDRVDEVIKGLRCIWISHIHADHHAGLTRYNFICYNVTIRIFLFFGFGFGFGFNL